MIKDQAYSLFEKMIKIADLELKQFTLHSKLSIERKVDKSAVTLCDKNIDMKLSAIANENGLQVISEEGEHVDKIVRSGNYITIDPIDGTLGYIEYVNHALERGDINLFMQEDLGALSDFALLLGTVENGVAQYGCVYNYVTHEKILIDGDNKENTMRENNTRNYRQENVIYVDQREGDEIEKELLSLPNTTVIKQSALGLKSIYTIINPHISAITAHRVQTSGLWDVMPAVAASRAFGGNVYDANGDIIRLNEYIILPGIGATIIKGDKFNFILDKIKGTE